MQSDSGLALAAVQALEAGDLEAAQRFTHDLTHMHSAKQVKSLMAEAGAPVSYLKLAANAASEGYVEACTRFTKLALRYVDEDELVALLEEHRLSLVPQQAQSTSTQGTRLGFALQHA